MTTALWFASAPEVHSALLSTGPGSGPWLAAVGAWNALSTQYREAEIELQHVLAAVHTHGWEGSSAGQYVAAHQPYLSWLRQAATVCATTATELQRVAAAYLAAVAEMPSLAELANNHATHAVLTGTNFFGINTIPIAINETDYARMWIQAATTMAVYDSIASTALVAIPQLPPPPPILTVGPLGAVSFASPAQAQAAKAGTALASSQSTVSDLIDELFRALLPAPLWHVIDELNALSIADILHLLATNPAAAFTALTPLFTALLSLGQFVATGVLLWILQIGSALLLFGTAIALPLAITLSDPSRLTLPTELTPTPGTVHAAVPTGAGPTPAPAPPSPASTSATTPTSTAPTLSTNPTTPTAPTGTTGSVFYAVGAADPEPPDRPTVRDGDDAPTSSTAASSLAAAEATQNNTSRFRKRRRRRQDHTDPAQMHVREYLDDPAAELGHRTSRTASSRAVTGSSSSARGAGLMGRSGAVDHQDARGFIRLDSPVGGDADMPASRPLIPGTWSLPDDTP